MDEGGTAESEPMMASPSLATIKKSASQRSFKEGAASRRASFEPIASLPEESPMVLQEYEPPFRAQASPAPTQSAPTSSLPTPAASAKAASTPKPKASPPKAKGGSVSSRDFDTISLDSKQGSIMTRNSIRDYIRNERDTILRKNMALHETLKSEDHRREEFQARQLKNVGRSLPIYVRKLIRNLKRNVHKTMREKGGTPFSIVRGMFLHWDAEKNGALSFDNFSSCLSHLGMLIPAEDMKNIFNYYSKKTGEGELLMGYNELLTDIQSDEPSVLEFVEDEQHHRDENELRFEEHKDKYVVMPQIVKDFIEAVRHHVLKKMRAEGGTLYYHVSKVFTAYDFDYSSALCPDELLQAAKKKFNMAISLQECNDIVKFYDRKGAGEMDHSVFVKDICAGLAPILHFEEQTADSIKNAKEKLNANPFVQKPYRPPSNRVLEKLKDSVHKSLDYRLFKVGGSYKSWIHEAFAFWDPKVCIVNCVLRHTLMAHNRRPVNLLAGSPYKAPWADWGFRFPNQNAEQSCRYLTKAIKGNFSIIIF
jgi:Ca2+-binding EF-hand superfamily protein